jgi:hypothetical protein
VTFTNGMVGQAFSFNGESNYVSIPNSPSLNICVSSITVETWIKLNHLTADWNWEGIVTKGNTSWRLQATAGAKTVNFAASGASPEWVTGSRDVHDGQWHHVAGVYDGTNMSLYVDGTLDVSQPATGLISQNSSPLCIGANAQAYVPSCGCNQPGYFFDGLIDEVSIYNRALTALEIQAIYAAGSAGKCGPPAGSNYSLVLPVGNTTVQGDACSGVLNEVLRYQNVYGAAQFPAGWMLIRELRFRPCPDMGAFSTTISNIQINLSTTAAQPDALNTVFSNNVGADSTTVFQGTLAISSSSTGTPKNFDIVVPLTQPFLYNPAAGNLLLEVRNFTGAPIGNIADHAGSATDAASRAYSYNASATSASYLSTGSAVVQLIYSRVDGGSTVPVITSFTPAAAVPGANVTITGLNFSPTPANNIVLFGAVRATVLSASATSLTVRVPAGATYGPITVSVGGLVAYSP